MTTYANVIIDCKTVLRAHGSIGCARPADSFAEIHAQYAKRIGKKYSEQKWW